MTLQPGSDTPHDVTIDATLDPVARLNNTFRRLYSLNRDHVIAETPLIGLTLIGTGEIFRFEYGRQVKCYSPAETLPKIKGLMHAILGAHGAWRLLLREKDASVARETATALHDAIGEAIAMLCVELPAGVADPAGRVLAELRGLSEAWSSGRPACAEDLPLALARVQPFLQEVIRTTGDAAYSSLSQSFEAFKNESDPEDWCNCLMGVCGPGQGRRDSIEIAAAMAVMGNDAAGLRLFYLENALSVPDGLRSLASIIVERDLGQAVFDDPYRMWRDLFAEAAVEHVGTSFFLQLGPQRTWDSVS